MRVVLPAGMVQFRRFDVNALTKQLSSLETPRWVFLNLTAGAHGGLLTTMDKDVQAFSPLSIPSKDLLIRSVTRLEKSHYRIGLYVASQGPDLDFFSHETILRIQKNKPRSLYFLRKIEKAWDNQAMKMNTTTDQIFIDLIERQSMRYGNRISAWWFDHGRSTTPYPIITAARAGNPDAAVAWNGQLTRKLYKGDARHDRGLVWLPSRDGPYEDYTDGHVTLTRGPYGHPPWWKGNELIIKQIERCDSVDGAVPHVFIPLQNTWRGGPDVFPLRQAISWTERVIKAGGAITWAVALKPPEFKHPYIRDDVYAILKELDHYLLRNQISSAR